MKEFFGVVALDSKSVELSRIAQLISSNPRLDSFQVSTVCKDNIALSLIAHAGTSTSKQASTPISHGNCVLTGKLRLDNREQVLTKLAVDKTLWDRTSDALLILKAYLKWGERCAGELIGDFSFAIWNRQTRDLFICRDPFGTAEVFYFFQGEYFIFSSSLAFLLNHAKAPRNPNPLAIALSMFAVKRADGSMTTYKDISQIPSAHYLVLQNRRVKLSQYWSLDSIPSVRYPKDDDYIDAFRECFSTAVRGRVESERKVGITLSGGLDSGAVASVAARQLGAVDRQLHSFTSVPAFDVEALASEKMCCDEGPLASATAKYIQHTRHTLTSSRDISPIQGLKRALELVHQPLVAASNCFWLVSIYQEMQACGINVVLSGQYGNATISWAGNPSKQFRELISQGKFSRCWSEVQAYKQANDLPNSALFRQLMAALLIPQAVLEYRRYRAAGSTAWQSTPLKADLARHLKLDSLLYEQGAYTFSALNPDFRKFLLPVGIFSGTSVSARLAAGFGLDLRDPTTDKRLIEFCWGIPEEQYIKLGQRRLLIRRAMQGHLPNRVLNNNKFGLQAADLIWRLRASSSEVESELSLARQSPLCLEYLDIARMNQSFQDLQKKSDYRTTLQASHILMRGLSVAIFLRSFERSSREQLAFN